MVQLKVDSTGIDPQKSNGFEPYEGPVPKPGAYAAVIKSMRVKISGAGNPYFNTMFELADQLTPEKQACKGAPIWERIVPGESDMQKERVGKLSYAICGKVKANIDHDEVTDGGKVNKWGGKDPVGTRVKIVLRRGRDNSNEIIAEMSDLFAWPKDEEWPEGAPEGDDTDSEIEEVDPEGDEVEEEEDEVEDEAEDEEDVEGEFEARQEELTGLDRTALKKILKDSEHDPDFRVLKSHSDEDLVNAILDLEYPPEEGDEEEGDDEPPF